MKRSLPFLVILLLVNLALQAQESPLRFSIHVNPQISWYSSDEAEFMPDGSNFHSHMGLQMDLFFAPNYAFTMGFGFNHLGGKIYYAGPDSIRFDSKGEIISHEPGHSVKHKLQYFDIPLGLKLKTEEMGYATFFFQLGINPMININARATSDDEVIYKEDIRNSIHTFNLGYFTGAGVEYRLGGNTALIAGLRWNQGMIDVTENESDNANIKFNAVSLHLGVLF